MKINIRERTEIILHKYIYVYIFYRRFGYCKSAWSGCQSLLVQSLDVTKNVLYYGPLVFQLELFSQLNTARVYVN